MAMSFLLYRTTAASTASLQSYWTMGIYRDTAITEQAQYAIASAKIGNSAAQLSSN